MSLLLKGVTKLSELTIDAILNMTNLKIENLGAPDTDNDASRRIFSDLTGRWTLAQAHRGADDKIMVFKGAGADPVEEDKPTLAVGTVSNTIQHSNDAEKTVVDLEAYTKVKEVLLRYALLNCRIKFDMKGTSVGTAFKARIYKNGVAIGTERINPGTSYVTYSEDLAGFANGDLIQIYAKATDGHTTYIKNFRFYYDWHTNQDP